MKRYLQILPILLCFLSTEVRGLETFAEVSSVSIKSDFSKFSSVANLELGLQNTFGDGPYYASGSIEQVFSGESFGSILTAIYLGGGYCFYNCDRKIVDNASVKVDAKSLFKFEAGAGLVESFFKGSTRSEIYSGLYLNQLTTYSHSELISFGLGFKVAKMYKSSLSLTLFKASLRVILNIDAL